MKTTPQKIFFALAILAGAAILAASFGLQFFAFLDFYGVKP